MKSDLQFKQDDKIIRGYLKEIKRKLPIYGRNEKEFLRILSQPMYDFAETSSDESITMESLVERFGTADECVETYVKTCFDHLSDNDMNHSISSRKYLKIAIAGLAVISVVSLCTAAISHKKLQESRKSDIRSETIVIREYEPYSEDNNVTSLSCTWTSAKSASNSKEMGE